MNLSLLTTDGLKTFTDVASLEDYTEVDGKEVFHITFFNPKMEDVLFDKKAVLLIQVTK